MYRRIVDSPNADIASLGAHGMQHLRLPIRSSGVCLRPFWQRFHRARDLNEGLR
jgi:hypothetical protein